MARPIELDIGPFSSEDEAYTCVHMLSHIGIEAYVQSIHNDEAILCFVRGFWTPGSKRVMNLSEKEIRNEQD